METRTETHTDVDRRTSTPTEDFTDEKFEAVIEKVKETLEDMAARARESIRKKSTRTMNP